MPSYVEQNEIDLQADLSNWLIWSKGSEETDEEDEELETDNIAQFEPRASGETLTAKSNSRDSRHNTEVKQQDIIRVTVTSLQRPGSEVGTVKSSISLVIRNDEPL